MKNSEEMSVEEKLKVYAAYISAKTNYDDSGESDDGDPGEWECYHFPSLNAYGIFRSKILCSYLESCLQTGSISSETLGKTKEEAFEKWVKGLDAYESGLYSKSIEEMLLYLEICGKGVASEKEKAD